MHRAMWQIRATGNPFSEEEKKLQMRKSSVFIVMTESTFIW